MKNQDQRAAGAASPATPRQAANRADAVRRIVEVLDALGSLPEDLLRRIDTDVTWWRAWQAARIRKCPSHETRAAVREAIRARLPELRVLETAPTAPMSVHDPAEDLEVIP